MVDHNLKKHIQNSYSKIFAAPPARDLPIRTGRKLAEFLGYPQELFDKVADDLWTFFLPCGNPLPLLHARAGDIILNIGCGAGIDSLALTSLYGSEVSIVNVDIVFTILKKMRSFCLKGRPVDGNWQWVCGDAQMLPFAHRTFDWVLANGVLNLFPDKGSILSEIKGVLKPGGFLVGADLCATTSIPDYFKEEKDAWVWCMAGAGGLDETVSLFEKSGLRCNKIITEPETDMFDRVLFRCQAVPETE